MSVRLTTNVSRTESVRLTSSNYHQHDNRHIDHQHDNHKRNDHQHDNHQDDLMIKQEYDYQDGHHDNDH